MEAMDDIRKILGIKPYQESDFDFFRGTSTGLMGAAGGLLFLGVMIRSEDMVISGVCLTIMGIMSVVNTILIRKSLNRV
ncbi:MAG: hypothetical protein PHI67_10595 [Candidatus Methanomethylophilaceae archaeon]|nr:hypothetical protein [Candidatus Methanomethylophilaceae archaeon]